MAKRVSRRRRGALLIDLMIAVFVVGFAALSFFSLFPTIARSHRIARDETVAQQMCVRLIEQLQLLKPSDVDSQTLTALNLIDTGQTASPYSFSHIPLDEASRYSPSQVLQNGRGTLTVTHLDANSVRLDVTIRWVSSKGKEMSVSSGTILGGYR
ncbi:MAG TPA: type II secretion system protein [Fimbriimonadaceae bacterium]|nr:type II secretion system protein [Fimbriimonadaceae bacterium]